MAEPTNEFDWHKVAFRYDWANWLDGQTWKLTKGVDWFTTPAAVYTSAYKQAKPRGLKIRQAVRGDTIYIKAVKEN